LRSTTLLLLTVSAFLTCYPSLRAFTGSELCKAVTTYLFSDLNPQKVPIPEGHDHKEGDAHNAQPPILPFAISPTGVPVLDKIATALVGFFAVLMDGKGDRNLVVFYLWCMSQFAGAWTLLVLESLRVGNRGRITSWYAEPFVTYIHSSHVPPSQKENCSSHLYVN
jgi:hypothetical protein